MGNETRRGLCSRRNYRVEGVYRRDESRRARTNNDAEDELRMVPAKKARCSAINKERPKTKMKGQLRCWVRFDCWLAGLLKGQGRPSLRAAGEQRRNRSWWKVYRTG